jgi:hypothetical protein
MGLIEVLVEIILSEVGVKPLGKELARVKAVMVLSSVE